MSSRFAIDDRIKAAGIALVLQALLVWALILGLNVDLPGAIGGALKVFAVGPPPPPPPRERIVPLRRRSRRPRGAAAPPALKATPTEVVAPPPIVPPPVPPPIVAAKDPGTGTAPAIGNADRPGVGSGTGGQGDGTGSGGRGNGDGDGDWTPPRRIRDMKKGDYPPAAADADIEGTVRVRFRVEIDGRVSGCVVVHGSGSAILDTATCPLIELRFRYRPSRDGDGHPVSSIVVMDNDWIIDNRHDGEARR